MTGGAVGEVLRLVSNLEKKLYDAQQKLEKAQKVEAILQKRPPEYHLGLAGNDHGVLNTRIESYSRSIYLVPVQGESPMTTLVRDNIELTSDEGRAEFHVLNRSQYDAAMIVLNKHLPSPRFVCARLSDNVEQDDRSVGRTLVSLANNTDTGGWPSKLELAGCRVSDWERGTFMDCADTDGDGLLDIDEFRSIFEVCYHIKCIASLLLPVPALSYMSVL